MIEDAEVRRSRHVEEVHRVVALVAENIAVSGWTMDSGIRGNRYRAYEVKVELLNMVRAYEGTLNMEKVMSGRRALSPRYPQLVVEQMSADPDYWRLCNQRKTSLTIQREGALLSAIHAMDGAKFGIHNSLA